MTDPYAAFEAPPRRELSQRILRRSLPYECPHQRGACQRAPAVQQLEPVVCIARQFLLSRHSALSSEGGVRDPSGRTSPIPVALPNQQGPMESGDIPRLLKALVPYNDSSTKTPFPFPFLKTKYQQGPDKVSTGSRQGSTRCQHDVNKPPTGLSKVPTGPSRAHRAVNSIQRGNTDVPHSTGRTECHGHASARCSARRSGRAITQIRPVAGR